MGKLTDTLKNMGYTFVADTHLLGNVPRLRVRSPRGQEMILGRNEQPLLFPGDTDGIPDNDWTGADGLTVASGSIYRDYYEMDDDAYCRFLHGMSQPLRDLFLQRKAAIGLNSAKVAAAEQFFVLDTYELDDLGTMEAGRYADGRFVAQAVPQGEEPVLRMHFQHLPDEVQTREAVQIFRLEQGLRNGALAEPDPAQIPATPEGIAAIYAQTIANGGHAPLGK